MIDIFDKKPLRLDRLTCHSGGAEGADTYFETIGDKYGVKTNAYSYKTKYHNSVNKVEISQEDFIEGINEVNRANKVLGRFGIHKYINLLARNWAQVKYSKEVFAIGSIVEPGAKGNRGYYNKSKYQVVDGGTGYACQMAINNDRDLYVFDQNKDKEVYEVVNERACLVDINLNVNSVKREIRNAIVANQAVFKIKDWDGFVGDVPEELKVAIKREANLKSILKE